jgi:magnesium transporter
MIKRIITYSNKTSKLLTTDIETALEENLGVVWIDIIEPQINEMNTLKRLFNFHPLTIEDCLEANQRPKLEEYPDYFFIVLAGVMRKKTKEDEFEKYQIALYLGKNFLITIREKRGGMSLRPIHNQILLKNTRILTHPSASFLTYMIIDCFIDSYLDLLEEIEDIVEEIEEIVVHKPETKLLDKIFDIRTALLIIVKAIRPQRSVIRNLAIEKYPLISPTARTFFTDVNDHILEANDLCSSYRDRINSTVEIYLSSASNKMNDTMKLLAVLTAIITIPNLLASIGGVNFTDFPTVFLQAPFWIFVGTIIVIMVVIIIIIRKMDL